MLLAPGTEFESVYAILEGWCLVQFSQPGAKSIFQLFRYLRTVLVERPIFIAISLIVPVLLNDLINSISSFEIASGTFDICFLKHLFEQ